MTITISAPADRYRDSLARVGYYDDVWKLHCAGCRASSRSAMRPSSRSPATTGRCLRTRRSTRARRASVRPKSVGSRRRGGFFKALHIPLIAGRLFDERDRMNGPHVAIVSASAQRSGISLTSRRSASTLLIGAFDDTRSLASSAISAAPVCATTRAPTCTSRPSSRRRCKPRCSFAPPAIRATARRRSRRAAVGR